jgi:phage gpG-like protein
MIRVEIDQNALQQVQQRLSALAPRVVARVYQELKPLLYDSFATAVQKYFLAGGLNTRGPAGDLLTSRSGKLLESVLKSFTATIDGNTLAISAGSDRPYAAIQEYGGYAGRKGPFKKENGQRPYIRPRPYLRPALSDLQDLIPGLLEQAIQQASVGNRDRAESP